jgi:hypothetical protein
MKKSALYALIPLVLFLVGCQQVSTDEISEAPPRIALLSSSRAALTSSTWTHYLEVWQDLSYDQKYAVWLEKLEETAALPQWTETQRNKILEKREGLSPSIFEVTATDEDEIAMLEELLPYFEPDQIERIFGHVYPYGHDITHGPIAINCTCKWSIYCGMMNTCDYGNCDITIAGCGFYGTSSCKGLCDNAGGI